MKPTKSQREWCARYAPAAKVKVIDFIPRAYCIAKPAVGCAVIVTPQADYLPHNAASHSGNDPFYSAVLLRDPWSGVSPAVETATLKIGDWVSVAFVQKETGSMDWMAFPLLPFGPLKQPAKKKQQIAKASQ